MVDVKRKLDFGTAQVEYRRTAKIEGRARRKDGTGWQLLSILPPRFSELYLGGWQPKYVHYQIEGKRRADRVLVLHFVDERPEEGVLMSRGHRCRGAYWSKRMDGESRQTVNGAQDMGLGLGHLEPGESRGGLVSFVMTARDKLSVSLLGLRACLGPQAGSTGAHDEVCSPRPSGGTHQGKDTSPGSWSGTAESSTPSDPRIDAATGGDEGMALADRIRESARRIVVEAQVLASDIAPKAADFEKHPLCVSEGEIRIPGRGVDEGRVEVLHWVLKDGRVAFLPGTGLDLCVNIDHRGMVTMYLEEEGA